MATKQNCHIYHTQGTEGAREAPVHAAVPLSCPQESDERCPGERVRVSVPVFICGCDHVGVCVCVCDQNTQYLSITQPNMKGVWNLSQRVFLLFRSFPQMKRNTGVQERRLSAEPGPPAAPEAELGPQHTRGLLFL